MLIIAALCAVATVGCPPAFAAPGRAVSFWVSPHGSDRSDGSHAHPFRTLVRARDAVRSLGPAARHAGVHVYLLGGVYRLTHALVLDGRDSGPTAGAVVWGAAAGAHPVISGAIRVGAWKLHDEARGIYEARIPAGLSTRELYVDGRRAVRARGETDPPGFVRTPTGFRAPNDAMDTWRNPRDVEAVTLTQWKMMRCPVQAIRGRDIVMQQPCWSNVNVFPVPVVLSDPELARELVRAAR